MLRRKVIVVAAALVVGLTACAYPQRESPAVQIEPPTQSLVPKASIAQHFELAKRSRPELIAFLLAMPKGADLHAHLDGSTFSEYVLQSAQERRRNYDLKTHQFTDSPAGQSVISSEELRSSLSELSDFRDHFSLRGWYPDTANGRDHFFSVFGRIASSGRTEKEMLAEVLIRNHIQNVQHFESIAPVVPESLIETLSTQLATFDINDLESAYRQVSEMLKGDGFAENISVRLDEWEQYATTALHQHSPDATELDALSVTYVPYVFRLGPLRQFFLSVAASMAAVNADTRVVALTLVGPEDLPDANELFKPQMRILDFLWRKMGHPAITLHAGELALKDATLFDMHDRIRTSIDVGHARRIGHGVSIGWEYDANGLLAQMAETNTLVEICLTSNEVILGISGDDHPFEMYRRAGVPVSLATDDEGISRSPLTMEFVKAVERYDLHYGDLQELVRNSLEYSFLSGDSLFVDGNFANPRGGFEDIWLLQWEPSESARRLLGQNEKLRNQVQLERSFVLFESEYFGH